MVLKSCDVRPLLRISFASWAAASLDLEEAPVAFDRYARGHRHVLMTGSGFKTQFAARLAGEKALRDLLDHLAAETD
jgi:hypothetical protein